MLTDADRKTPTQHSTSYTTQNKGLTVSILGQGYACVNTNIIPDPQSSFLTASSAGKPPLRESPPPVCNSNGVGIADGPALTPSAPLALEVC
jgi:hypothetical protein